LLFLVKGGSPFLAGGFSALKGEFNAEKKVGCECWKREKKRKRRPFRKFLQAGLICLVHKIGEGIKEEQKDVSRERG